MHKAAIRMIILIILAIFVYLVVEGLSNKWEEVGVRAYPPPFVETPPSSSYDYSTYLPVVSNSAPLPLWTTSYYMNTIDPNTLYNLGYELGYLDSQAPGTQYSVTILDFGQPWYQGGSYGVRLFINHEFVSTTQIEDAVESFALGYYIGTGDDNLSVLIIAVGTYSHYYGEVTYSHGAAWAQMVNNINSWIINQGYNWQVAAAGASNMEVGFNTPAVTRSWVDGYDSANNYYFYNFGDAQGCPISRTYGANTPCDLGWYQEDIWYISWGSPPAKPLPLIYATGGANANQWYSLSAYSFDAHGGAMHIWRSVTQYQACLQRGGCSGIDNTPEQGYIQLDNALNSDPDTAQLVNWSTDMKWHGE